MLVSELAKATDLAAPTGSGLVGYMPAGVSAVPRDVESVLRERASVLNFENSEATAGNWTTAVQTALNAGGAIDLCGGTYLLKKTTNTDFLTCNTAFALTNGTLIFEFDTSFSSNCFVLNCEFKLDGVTIVMRQAVAGTQSVVPSIFKLNGVIPYFSIRNCSISADGVRNGVQNYSNALVLQGAATVASAHIVDNTFYECGYGIVSSNNTAANQGKWVIAGNTFHNMRWDAIELNTPNAIFDSVTISGNIITLDDAAVITANPLRFGIGLAQVRNVTVVNNVIKGQYGDAIHLEDSSNNVSISGNIISGSIAGGINVQTVSTEINTIGCVSITGNVISGNLGVSLADDLTAYAGVNTMTGISFSVTGEYTAASRAVVTGNTVALCGIGIAVPNSVGSLTESNSISSCIVAVKVDDPQYNIYPRIQSNTIYNCRYAITGRRLAVGKNTYEKIGNLFLPIGTVYSLTLTDGFVFIGSDYREITSPTFAVVTPILDLATKIKSNSIVIDISIYVPNTGAVQGHSNYQYSLAYSGAVFTEVRNSAYLYGSTEIPSAGAAFSNLGGKLAVRVAGAASKFRFSVDADGLFFFAQA